LKSGNTILKKDPGHLAEVAEAAKKEGVKHITLTAGSTEGRRVERELLKETSRSIVRTTGLPVHAQLMPPISRGQLESLREAGVVSLGIHLESYDSDLLKRVAPYKASLPLQTYIQAWQDAVTVFGRGQVSSYLLMGLGETAQNLLEGCERLAALGVYPYLVPFRPIPGIPLTLERPIDPEAAKDIYRKAARILEGQGIDWKDVPAGCVRCRACSALPDFQEALQRKTGKEVDAETMAWDVVRSGPLLEACYAIRHEVFVAEQELFQGTDRDAWDSDSFHIVVSTGNQCIGTVRISQIGDNGLWLGSRLAVKKGYRGHVGYHLVKKAEEAVRHQGAKQFVALIQLSRVNFFQQCGWRCLKTIPDYHGKPHMLMKAAGSLWQQEASDLSVPEQILSHNGLGKN